MRMCSTKTQGETWGGETALGLSHCFLHRNIWRVILGNSLEKGRHLQSATVGKPNSFWSRSREERKHPFHQEKASVHSLLFSQWVILLTSSITDLTVVSMLTPWPGIIDVLKPIITAFHNWAWNRSVDSHNHILPSFHYSFNVCICRICHRYKENTPAQQVRGGFFPSLTLSPSYKGDNENSPSYKWDHEKSHHCIYRWSSKANAKWTDTRKWASAVQQRSRHAAHRHPVCPASKKCSLSC